MRKPSVVDGKLEGSMLDAVRYLLHRFGRMSDETTGLVYAREFPGVRAPKDFRSFLSANASMGRLTCPASGMYHVSGDDVPEPPLLSLEHPSAAARIVHLLESKGPQTMAQIQMFSGIPDDPSCAHSVYAAVSRGLIERTDDGRYRVPANAKKIEFRNRVPFNVVEAVAELVRVSSPAPTREIERRWAVTYPGHVNYNVRSALCRAKSAGLVVSAGRGRWATANWYQADPPAPEPTPGPAFGIFD